MDPLPPPPDDLDEDSGLQQALRAARPSWATDGHGLRGPHPERTSREPMAGAPSGAVVREPRQPAFPDLAEDQPTAADAVAANTNEYSFELQNYAPAGQKAINQDTGEVKIHVGYGEIRNISGDGSSEPPDGMTGADDYFLTISADGTEIYGIVTYDQDTLAFTSRTLGFGASVPDSVAGTVYVGIGFVDITYDGGGKIKEVSPHNRHCGDINLALIYAAFSGAPALYPLQGLSNPVAIDLS